MKYPLRHLQAVESEQMSKGPSALRATGPILNIVCASGSYAEGGRAKLLTYFVKPSGHGEFLVMLRSSKGGNDTALYLAFNSAEAAQEVADFMNRLVANDESAQNGA